MTLGFLPLALLHSEHVSEHLEVVGHLVPGADLPADRRALLYVSLEGDRLRLMERPAEGGLAPARSLPEPPGLAQVLGNMLVVVQLLAVAADHILEVWR